MREDKDELNNSAGTFSVWILRQNACSKKHENFWLRIQ